MTRREYARLRRHAEWLQLKPRPSMTQREFDRAVSFVIALFACGVCLGFVVTWLIGSN